MNKLQEMIRAKFGKQSQVRFLTSVSPVSAGSFGVMRKDLTLPIELADGFYVTLIVQDGFDLNDKQKREIVDLAGIYLGRSAMKQAEQIRAANKQVSFIEDTHVIPLGAHVIDEDFVNLLSDVEIRDAKVATEFTEKAYVFNGVPTSAKAFGATPAQRISAVFHDLAQTWAQIRWSDIRTTVSLAQDLRALGKVTLVIESWSSLPSKEKQQLLKFITELRFEENSPYFLIFQSEHIVDDDLETFAVIEASRLPMNGTQLEQTLDLLLSREKENLDFHPVN